MENKRETILTQGRKYRETLLNKNPFNDLGAGEYGQGGLSREISDDKTPQFGKEPKDGIEELSGNNVGSAEDIKRRIDLRNKNYYKYNNHYGLSHTSDGDSLTEK